MRTAASGIILPPPSASYDAASEREFRRILELGLNRLAVTRSQTLPWFDPADYGAVGDGVSDDTLALQAAIDAASEQGGGTVLLAADTTYIVDAIVLKYGVRIEGPGRFAITRGGSPSTYIKAKAGSTSPAVILLDEGPVQNVALSGFTLIGNGNAGQAGMFLQAVATLEDGVMQGGMWFFRFFDLYVHGFDAEQIWLCGGGDPHNAPIQFGEFINVQLIASTTAAGIRMSGQVAQIDFNAGCRFVGQGRDTGTVTMLIERAVDENGTLIGDASPYTLNIAATIELNTALVRVERAEQINFVGAHFEEASYGLTFLLSAVHGVVEGCMFGLVGEDGSGTGWAVKSYNGAKVTVINNSFADGNVSDMHYFGDSSLNSLNVLGYHYVQSGPLITAGCTGPTPPPRFVSTTGTVDASRGTELCDATGGAITRTLPSSSSLDGVLPGTRITIKKYDGSANAVTVDGGPDGITYTLSRGNQWIEVEADGAGGWKVISMGVPQIPVSTSGLLSLAGTNASPWGFASQADFDLLVDMVNDLYTANVQAALVT